MSSDGPPQPRSALQQVTLLYRNVPQHCALSPAHKRELRAFCRALPASFNCLFTDDTELQRLNALFLSHNYPTDVLSFPSGSPQAHRPRAAAPYNKGTRAFGRRGRGPLCAGSSEGNLGEIAISVERAAAQAAAFGHPLLDELRILLLHGYLHLTGLDHEVDTGEMARAERKWRKLLGLPLNLIARSSRARSTPAP